MTKQEFTNRTLVQVTDKEYAAIEVVYMASDLDKDQFCKMWCKMNATRVQSAKVERMIENRRNAQKDVLMKMVARWMQFEGECKVNAITCLWMKGSEVVALDTLGIKDGYYMTETIYNVRQYFKQAA